MRLLLADAARDCPPSGPQAAFPMKQYIWYSRLKELFHAAVDKYRAGQRDAATYFSPDETAYLASIGQTAQEIYDFAEDHARGGEPDWETVLLISAARRDYFGTIQKGELSRTQIKMESLPPKDAAIEGIEWLPRLIEKALAKLQGELPADLMYDCGGDRAFFTEHDIHPADFLRVTWSAQGDSEKIVSFVKKK